MREEDFIIERTFHPNMDKMVAALKIVLKTPMPEEDKQDLKDRSQKDVSTTA